VCYIFGSELTVASADSWKSFYWQLLVLN